MNRHTSSSKHVCSPGLSTVRTMHTVPCGWRYFLMTKRCVLAALVFILLGFMWDFDSFQLAPVGREYHSLSVLSCPCGEPECPPCSEFCVIPMAARAWTHRCAIAVPCPLSPAVCGSPCLSRFYGQHGRLSFTSVGPLGPL